MKISLPLLLCRILLCLLILTTVGCFCLSMVDTTTTDDLTEEERTALTEKNSFKYSVRGLNKLKLFSEDLSFEDIIYIKCLGLKIRTVTGNTVRQLVCLGTTNSDKDVYIDFSFGCEKISKKEYTELYKEYHMQGETVYSGVELKLIKEIAGSEDINETLRQWRQEELESFKSLKFVRKALLTYDVSKELENITSISTVLLKNANSPTPGIYVIKIDVGNAGKTFYYTTPDTLQGRMIEATESMYDTYASNSMCEKETYTDKDIQILLEDMGVIQ